MLVKAVKSFAGANFSMTTGEERDLDTDIAEKYIRIGYVSALEKKRETKAVVKNETKRNKIK